VNLEVRSLDSNFYLLISYLESSVEGCVCLCELCGKYSAMCCASLKLDFLPAPLVQGMLRFFEAGMLAKTRVKTTCSIGFEKSFSMQGLKPPAPKVM
jgi:hypothetical protein